MKKRYSSINRTTKIVIIFLLIIFIFILFQEENIMKIVYNLRSFFFEKFYFVFFDAVNVIVICLIILCLTKYGKVKIGGSKSKIDYSNFEWYSMLFSAGMGIGIMFYGVAEPLMHFYDSPIFNVSNKSFQALATTYLSWGIHAWAIYALLGLAFGYFAYNKGLPMGLRSLFYPIFKDNIYGKLGDFIDAFGIIITLFALSASLGIGVVQINSGLNYLFGFSIGYFVQILIIVIVIAVACISVVSGISNGVKILSKFNLYMVILLGAFLFILGPMIDILINIIGSSVTYFSLLPWEALHINSVDTSWNAQWGIFYMSWWISWSVFVGIFIAKISKGRSIREFILSVLIIPTILSIIWFGILGTDAIHVNEGGELLSIINQNVSLSLFAMISYLVSNEFIQHFLQGISLVIIILFFITSSDSGAIVVSELAMTKGSAKNFQKIFWTILQGIITIVLLIIGKVMVLELIQNILLIISLPLTIFLIYLVVMLIILIIKENN